MGVWIVGLTMAVVVGGTALRIAYVARRRRWAAARRRVEAPNSHYSSIAVRNQEDRERWGSIDRATLHPLNQEEVERLLDLLDANGVHALSARDRTFLDNMTLPRTG